MANPPRTRKQLAEAITQLRADVATKVRQHGWTAITILDPTAPYTYSVGFTAKGLPELVVFGIAPETVREVFGEVHREVLAGRPYRPGLYQPEGFGFPVWLLPIPEPTADTLIRVAIAEYGAAEALQLVVPDEKGRFPWEEGCDPDFIRVQPLQGQAPEDRWN